MLAARRTALRIVLATLVALLALAGTAGAASTDPQVQLADADQIWAQNFVASSGSTVWQTPEHAQADWDRMAQPQLLSCLSSALSAGSTKQLRIVIRAKKQLPFASVAPRTAAYRIAFAFQLSRKVKRKLKKTSLPATFDLVLVGNGRATGLLIFVALSKPLTATYEQSVAQLVAQRLAKDPAATQ